MTLPLKCLLSATAFLVAASGAVELTTESFFQGTTMLRGHAGEVRAVAFSPGAQTLASAGADSVVRLWDLARNKERERLSAGKPVWSLAFSPDTTRLAAAGDDGLLVWDLRARARPLAIERGRRLWAAAFSPDSRLLAAAGDDGWIGLWDARTGKPKGRMRAAECTISALAFSPDGRLLAAAAADHRVYVWEPARHSLRSALAGHGDWVWSVAFSPDGKTLASGGNDDTIRLWDVERATETARLTGRSRRVLSVAFSPDGKTLASGSYDLVLLWDLASRRERASYTRHRDWVRSVSFSPDGKYLASGSEDSTIMLLSMDAVPPASALPGALAPARLTAHASLERDSILVTVTNAGAGPAYLVRILGLPEEASLGTIMPGRTLNKRLPLPPGALAGRFLLRVTEGHGFDAEPLAIGR